MQKLPVAIALILVTAFGLSACSAPSDEDISERLSDLDGVETVRYQSNMIRVALEEDLDSVDAQRTMVAVRDLILDQVPDADELNTLRIIVNQDENFSSYGDWLLGAVAGDAFDQQATFVADLADWESPATTDIEISSVRLEVYRPTNQNPSITLNRNTSVASDPDEVDRLQAEVRQIWIDSGGPDEVTVT